MGGGGVVGGSVCAFPGEAGEELRELGVVGVPWGDVDRDEAHRAGDVSDELGRARKRASGESAVVAC